MINEMNKWQPQQQQKERTRCGRVFDSVVACIVQFRRAAAAAAAADDTESCERFDSYKWFV